MGPVRFRALSTLLALAVLMSFAVTGGAWAKPLAAPKGAATTGSRIQAVLDEDAYEADDTTATANPAPPKSTHTFHDGDIHDYMYVSADMAGQPFMFETMYRNDGPYDTVLNIRDASGAVLASDDDSDVWPETYSSTVYWTAPAPGTYFIDVYNLSGEVYSYDLFVTKGDARRIWGSNRYTNAIAVSFLQWDNTTNEQYGSGYGPEDIFLANGENYADASAAAALATQAEGVLLLTRGDSLNPETKAEITRLSESNYWDDNDVKVWLLGGSASLSASVENAVKGLRNITMVERIGGASRFEVASRVASITANNETENSVNFNNVAFVCNYAAWADQISVAPVAAWAGGVVLFTYENDVPDATMDFIDSAGVTEVYVVGGPASVGDAAIDELEAEVGAGNVTVLAGANRYATAQKVAQHGVDEYGMDGNLCTLASGEVFADALTAAPISWWTDGPILLTRGDALSPEVAAYFDDNGGIDPGCYVVGGPATVSDGVLAALRDLYKDYLP